MYLSVKKKNQTQALKSYVLVVLKKTYHLMQYIITSIIYIHTSAIHTTTKYWEALRWLKRRREPVSLFSGVREKQLPVLSLDLVKTVIKRDLFNPEDSKAAAAHLLRYISESWDTTPKALTSVITILQASSLVAMTRHSHREKGEHWLRSKEETGVLNQITYSQKT